MNPPTVDTFAAIVRMRYNLFVRMAIGGLRRGESPDFALGVAKGMVYVLYDLGASDAHQKLKRVYKLQNWNSKQKKKVKLRLV